MMTMTTTTAGRPTNLKVRTFRSVVRPAVEHDDDDDDDDDDDGGADICPPQPSSGRFASPSVW
eukprot:6802043-Pyramimonas_sp.AAC.1